MPALDHPPAEGTEGRGDVLAGAALLIAAFAYWWPILGDLQGRVAGGTGDPLLNAYLITWIAGHLGDAALWNPPFFYPAGGVLAYSDHLLGLGAAAWPLVQAGASPVAIVNVLSMVASLATSLALYAWLRDCGSAPAPAAAAAITVVYSAWRHLQIAHLQLQFTAFLPLALLCYSRVLAGRGPGGWAWLGAAALALQTLFTPTLSVYMLPLVAVWLVVAGTLMGQRAPTYRLLAASLAVAAAVNLPIAQHYWHLGDALDRGIVEIAEHSAAWVDWISAPPHWLYGETLAFTRGRERELFPGIGFVLVTVAGSLTVRRGRGAGLAIAGLVTTALAAWAAAGLTGDGWSITRLPYELFYRLMPGGGQVRVPVRFVLPAAIFLAPVIAAGWTRVHLAIAARRAGLAPLLTLLLAGVVSAEAMAGHAWFESAMPLSVRLPDGAAPGPIVMLPLHGGHGQFGELSRMWSARLAGVPIVNGYSGHESPLYRQLRRLHDTEQDEDSRRVLYALLKHDGVNTIVASEGASAWIDRSRLQETAPGVFQIPDEARRLTLNRIEMSRGAGLVVTESGWSYPEKDDRESWVWSTSMRATLRVPLGGVRRRTIVFRARSQSSDADELEVWWRGRRLGVQRLDTGPAFHAFRLPEAAAELDWIDLELRGPRPIRLPGNPDIRALSVCLFEIRLE